jgi:hypothetical protein
MPECLLTKDDWEVYFKIEQRGKERIQREILAKQVIKNKKIERQWKWLNRQPSWIVDNFRIFWSRLDPLHRNIERSIKECYICGDIFVTQAGLVWHGMSKHNVNNLIPKHLMPNDITVIREPGKVTRV